MSRPQVYKRFVTMAVLLSLCSPLFITNTRARAASQPLSNLSTSKISPDLQRLILSGNGDTRVKAIVQKMPSSSGGLLGGLIGGLLNTVGGLLVSVLSNLNVLVVDVQANDVQVLASDP